MGSEALKVKLHLLERRSSIAQRRSETEVLGAVPEVRRKRGRRWCERNGSAVTQAYESCQVNHMDVDMDENQEQLSYIPSAVSSSAGWHEPK